MDEARKRVLRELLRMAAEEFARHGCNDFDLREIIPDKADREALVRDIAAWSKDPDPSPDADLTADWLLMSYFAATL